MNAIFKDNKAGSGVVVYFDNKIIDKITSPIGDQSIAFAELNAIYVFLQKLKLDNSFNGCFPCDDQKEPTPIHFLQIAFILSMSFVMILSELNISI